tara:strand:+ start:9052 stop:9612 length:561 start_codon:yes stop_codon:yes gene_type:complete
MLEKNKVFIFIGILLFPIAFVLWQKRKIAMAKTEKEKFVRYDSLFKLYANGRFPWRWLKAIAKQESDLGENRLVRNGQVSSDGKSFGLMQIAEGLGSPTEIALKGFGGQEKLNDPDYSIQKASELVNFLNDKFRGDEFKVFLGYNQGEVNTMRGRDFTKQHNNGRSYADLILKHLDWIDRKEKELA